MSLSIGNTIYMTIVSEKYKKSKIMTCLFCSKIIQYKKYYCDSCVKDQMINKKIINK